MGWDRAAAGVTDPRPTGGRWRGRHWNRRSSPSPGQRPRDTHMAALATRTSRSPCARCCPAWSVAPQLPLSPPPATAPPCTPPPSRPAPPPAHWAPPLALPQFGHPWRRPLLAPPSWVTERPVARGAHQLAGRRDPGGRDRGGSARDPREQGVFPGTGRKGSPVPSHADPETGFVVEPRLPVSSSDSVASRDLLGPPICDSLKQVLEQPLLGWAG